MASQQKELKMEVMPVKVLYPVSSYKKCKKKMAA